MAIFCNRSSNNWETVVDRRVHAATRLQAWQCLSVHAKFSAIGRTASPGGKKNEVKMAERNAVQDMDIVATEC